MGEAQKDTRCPSIAYGRPMYGPMSPSGHAALFWMGTSPDGARSVICQQPLVVA